MLASAVLSLVVGLLAQTPALPSVPAQVGLTWKAVLLTGDDSIPAFDNARKKMSELLLAAGIPPENIRQLSMDARQQVDGVSASSAVNLQQAFSSMQLGDRDACLLHMTSHGSPRGFMLRNAPSLTPARLNAILDDTCGSRPTVVLISACFSGTFVREEMQRPNRVILTAARDDLSSFGCSPESQYTYWDSCLIENLPKSSDWQQLYDTVKGCIEVKETRGRFVPSMPQAFFGASVSALGVPSPTASPMAVAASRCAVADESSYGFSDRNAIKVGLDGFSGPAREMQYLSALRGPAGQRIAFQRVGSKVGSDKTILNIYQISYEGLGKPLRLFFDEYHFDEPKVPQGLVCVMPFRLGRQ